MANLQLIITALNKASGEINKVKNEIEGVGKSGKVAEPSRIRCGRSPAPGS